MQSRSRSNKKHVRILEEQKRRIRSTRWTEITSCFYQKSDRGINNEEPIFRYLFSNEIVYWNPSINNVDDAYRATGTIQKSDYEDLTKSIFSGLFQSDVYVRKAIVQEEQQLVYGIVYEPDVLDSQGDYMTAESIQKAAHAFMTSLKVDTQHNFVEGAGTVVESYIAQSTFEIGEHVIKKVHGY